MEVKEMTPRKTINEIKEKLKQKNIFSEHQFKRIEELVKEATSKFSAIEENEFWEYILKFIEFRIAFKENITPANLPKEYFEKQTELKERGSKERIEEEIKEINEICKKLV
ncbi:MAG: hypothetical protein ACOC1P_01740 [Minisyncoccales bacterium]